MAEFHDQMECINSALQGNQFGIDLSSLIIQGDMPLYLPVSTAQYKSQAGFKIKQNQSGLPNGSFIKPSELPCYHLPT